MREKLIISTKTAAQDAKGFWADLEESLRKLGTDYIDINYVLSDAYEYAAKVTDPEAGISMSVKTSFPGLQLYNGNYIGNCTGKYNLPYNNQHGICFEPQFFPDSMHHNNFPSPVLKAGERLDRYIEYIF